MKKLNSREGCKAHKASARVRRAARSTRWLSLFFLLILQGRSLALDEWLDALDDRLSWSAFDRNFAAHLSGSLDLEGYLYQQPPPALLESNRDFLFAPRLTLFLDSQIGPKLYLFVQSRVDRGFDPADADLGIRLDEYALRFTPWEDGRLNIQVGKFATVVGHWASRHDSWDNPFITAPLPYENLTSMWDSAAADSALTLIDWYDSKKSLRLPIVWGPSYATGIAVSGRLHEFDYALEIKNASLSSRPDTWDLTKTDFSHPTVSGRLGWRPNQGWDLGFSASTGSYLQSEAVGTLAAGSGLGDYRQLTLAQDIGYAWHHWQLWAECFENRFEIPMVGNADSLAYFVEAKYKFTPQLFGALRWNQQVYNDFPYDDGTSIPWSYNSWRSDAALTYRLTTHTQVKVQYSFLKQDRAERQNQHLLALQFTVRF